MDFELTSENAHEIVLDGSNKVSFPGFPYTFEALGEKILVSLDAFKSGYECRKCKGKGKIEVPCACMSTDRPKYRYDTEALKEIRTSLGAEVALTREGMVCPICSSSDWTGVVVCPDCEGKTATLIIPETAKILSSSGVVVSMGAEARLKAAFKVGDRILFGHHSGSLIPTKSNLMFKQLDWYQAWVKVEGADDLDAFDFIRNPDVTE